jgi:hypothetical protein
MNDLTAGYMTDVAIPLDIILTSIPLRRALPNNWLGFPGLLSRNCLTRHLQTYAGARCNDCTY